MEACSGLAVGVNRFEGGGGGLGGYGWIGQEPGWSVST